MIFFVEKIVKKITFMSKDRNKIFFFFKLTLISLILETKGFFYNKYSFLKKKKNLIVIF